MVLEQEQRACFPEFCFTPCFSLDPERVCLGPEGSWSRAMVAGVALSQTVQMAETVNQMAERVSNALDIFYW